MIFVESIRDFSEFISQAPIDNEKDTVVHETGHTVGQSGDEPVTDGNSNFFSNYLKHIRSSAKPDP